MWVLLNHLEMKYQKVSNYIFLEFSFYLSKIQVPLLSQANESSIRNPDLVNVCISSFMYIYIYHCILVYS